MRKTDTDQRRFAPGHRRVHPLLALKAGGKRPGYTLVEMMVALAVAAILAGSAAPSLQAMLQKQQLRTALNDLLGAVALTRSLAIARGGVVMMAPIDPAGAAWEQGWTVFADRNANRRPDPGEERIAVQQPLAEGIRIASRFTSGAGAQYLAYNAGDIQEAL